MKNKSAIQATGGTANSNQNKLYSSLSEIVAKSVLLSAVKMKEKVRFKRIEEVQRCKIAAIAQNGVDCNVCVGAEVQGPIYMGLHFALTPYSWKLSLILE